MVSVVRDHPGDDQRDAGVHGEAIARRRPGAAEAGSGGQPAGLSGRHAGETAAFGRFSRACTATTAAAPAGFTGLPLDH